MLIPTESIAEDYEKTPMKDTVGEEAEDSGEIPMTNITNIKAVSEIMPEPIIEDEHEEIPSDSIDKESEKSETSKTDEESKNGQSSIDDTDIIDKPDISDTSDISIIDEIKIKTTSSSVISITGIQFTEATYILKVNETCQTVVQVVYDDNSVADITTMCVFDISNDEIAEVDASGVITAYKAGQAQIYAEYWGYICSADITVLPQPLDIPENMTAESFPYQINISWDEVEGAEWYEIEVDGINCTVTDTVYNHINLCPNTLHEYRIKAANEYVESDWSTILPVLTKLETPANLAATLQGNIVTLSWDPVPDATGYIVYKNDEEAGTVSENNYTVVLTVHSE